jgi:hypothetical protein
VSLPVQAEELSADRLYLGGGFNFNDVSSRGSATGFQFFGGYEFKFKWNEDISTALEVGYMDSGNFDHYKARNGNKDAKGVWAAVLESVPLSNKTDMLVRLGYDFGNDDGVLLGTGLQYKFDTKLAFRMEYVARQHVNSLQANLLYKF